MRLAAIAMSVGLFGCSGGIDQVASGCALACHGAGASTAPSKSLAGHSTKSW